MFLFFFQETYLFYLISRICKQFGPLASLSPATFSVFHEQKRRVAALSRVLSGFRRAGCFFLGSYFARSTSGGCFNPAYFARPFRVIFYMQPWSRVALNAILVSLARLVYCDFDREKRQRAPVSEFLLLKFPSKAWLLIEFSPESLASRVRLGSHRVPTFSIVFEYSVVEHECMQFARVTN